MTLCLTFGLLPWTLEDTDLRWYVSCQSPSDKLSLWSRILLLLRVRAGARVLVVTVPITPEFTAPLT